MAKVPTINIKNPISTKTGTAMSNNPQIKAPNMVGGQVTVGSGGSVVDKAMKQSLGTNPVKPTVGFPRARPPKGRGLIK